MNLDRRELLTTGTSALGVAVAGCVAEPIDDTEEADTEDDAEDTGDEPDEDTNEGDDEGELDDADDDEAGDEEAGDDTGADDDETEDDEEAEDETADEEETDDEEGEEPPVSEITVTVVDPDGEPIEGAEIHGQGEPHDADIPLEFSGETNAEGVHATPIYENEYTIETLHDNFESTTIDHTHDGDTEVTIELEPVVEEPPSSEIRIRVTDSDGEPIEGAEIHGEGDAHPTDIPLEFDGETDESGIHATPIYQNEYTIEIDHPEYEPASVEHVHDGETELTVELEAYENEIVNDTPLEVSELSPRDENEGCNVHTSVSHEEEVPVQFDYEFVAYDGEEAIARDAGTLSFGSGHEGAGVLGLLEDELDDCGEATHFVLRLDNYREGDHEEGDVSGEVTVTPDAERVLSVEDHEFDDEWCRVGVGLVNDSDESITAVVEFRFEGDGEASEERESELDPGESQKIAAPVDICSDIESYDLRVDVE